MVIRTIVRNFSSSSATAVGLGAIVFWGMSAQLLSWASALPSFEVLFISFLFGSFLLLLWGRNEEGSFHFLRQPWHYYVVVTALLFINNAAYTFALRMAPLVSANMVNYLWPLLIVLLSTPVLGKRLHGYHLVGVLLGFSGCGLLMVGGENVQVSLEAWPGYACAFTGALAWAVYSLVLKRYYPNVPTATLAPIFFFVAVLSLCMYPAAIAPWRWPVGREWAALAASGAGTLAAAYACWDYGAKKGDVRVMSGASYLTPLLSTAVLSIFGDVPVTANGWIACVMIICGAAIAGWKEFFAASR